MEKTDKERLFEVFTKVDPTFKLKEDIEGDVDNRFHDKFDPDGNMDSSLVNGEKEVTAVLDKIDQGLAQLVNWTNGEYRGQGYLNAPENIVNEINEISRRFKIVHNALFESGLEDGNTEQSNYR